MLVSQGDVGWSGSCGNLPGGACSEQGQRIAAAHGGRVRQIDFECRIQACTRALGAGTAKVTLTDGKTITETWSYTGDPNPLPVAVCTGLAFALCQQWATSGANDLAPSRRIAGIAVKCSAASCTEQAGDVEVVYTFADGSTETSGMGWSGAPPAS
jgi:hypothetical protein